MDLAVFYLLVVVTVLLFANVLLCVRLRASVGVQREPCCNL